MTQLLQPINVPLKFWSALLARATKVIYESKGVPGTRTHAPRDPDSFIFIQFSTKHVQTNRTLAVGAPQKNPGSTESDLPFLEILCEVFSINKNKITEVSNRIVF